MKVMAQELEEVIASMRNSVTEIRGVEIRIQRIAINATLRATHIGAAGDALNVIAGVMRSLALDSNTKTEDVAKALDAMTAATRASGNASQSGAGVEGGTDPVIDEMKRSIKKLHAASESSFKGGSHCGVRGEAGGGRQRAAQQPWGRTDFCRGCGTRAAGTRSVRCAPATAHGTSRASASHDRAEDWRRIRPRRQRGVVLRLLVAGCWS